MRLVEQTKEWELLHRKIKWAVIVKERAAATMMIVTTRAMMMTMVNMILL
jgi:hypothetical protein